MELGVPMHIITVCARVTSLVVDEPLPRHVSTPIPRGAVRPVVRPPLRPLRPMGGRGCCVDRVSRRLGLPISLRFALLVLVCLAACDGVYVHPQAGEVLDSLAEVLWPLTTDRACVRQLIGTTDALNRFMHLITVHSAPVSIPLRTRARARAHARAHTHTRTRPHPHSCTWHLARTLVLHARVHAPTRLG